MAYIKLGYFKVRLGKLAVMDFIARTPSDMYCLIPVGQDTYCGIVISENVIEYLLNEFSILSFEVMEKEPILQIIENFQIKAWGNRELLVND